MSKAIPQYLSILSIHNPRDCFAFGGSFEFQTALSSLHQCAKQLEVSFDRPEGPGYPPVPGSLSETEPEVCQNRLIQFLKHSNLAG